MWYSIIFRYRSSAWAGFFLPTRLSHVSTKCALRPAISAIVARTSLVDLLIWPGLRPLPAFGGIVPLGAAICNLQQLADA